MFLSTIPILFAFGAALPISALPSSSSHQNSLRNNLAFRSPSSNHRARSLAIDHEELYLRKRWSDTYQSNLSFPYGVASGDADSTSVILWTRPQKAGPNAYNDNPPICLKWLVATQNTNFTATDSVASGYVQTTIEVDWSTKVEVTGLKPLTQYYYRWESCEEEASPGKGFSPVGSFKTLPDDNAMVEKLRFAVFSCSKFTTGYFNAYAQAAGKADELQAWLHLGDYIYEGPSKASDLPGRHFKPDRELSTLQDYRDRYANYRGDDHDLAELHRKLTIYSVWDDHEVADNTYNGGSADSNDTTQGYIGGVPFSGRKGFAVRAYYEWMPIRQVATDDKLRIWRSFKLGKLGTLLMIDTRQYERGITDIYYNTNDIKAISHEENRTMTGTRQQQWITGQLSEHKKRGATWPILAQQVIFSSVNFTLIPTERSDLNYDAWDGYQVERDHILGFIEKEKINNTIVLSGDTHTAWAFDVKRYTKNTVYDPSTGEGALGVEWAGTAVSSTSGYAPLPDDAAFIEVAKNLTRASPALQFAETQLRGYFEYQITPTSASAEYYGFYNESTRNSDVINVASFSVDVNTNRLKRPINGGKQPRFDYLGAGASHKE